VENLKNIEAKMVYICELKYGETLDGEERTAEDLIYFQEGNDNISAEYLKYFEEGKKEKLGCQVGKEEMRLYESLKNSEKSSYQQGVLTEKKENMRLYESLRNSGESSDQQGVLIGEKEEEEDHHHQQPPSFSLIKI
jgi:hypothetical protein